MIEKSGPCVCPKRLRGAAKSALKCGPHPFRISKTALPCDVGIALAAKIAGPEFGAFLELALEYAPEPPFGVGRPELAPPALAESVRAAIGKTITEADVDRAAAALRLRKANRKG